MVTQIYPEWEVPVFWNIPLGRIVFTDVLVDSSASFSG
jgi:hypothetical protein